jgi:hypothetical protein
MSHRVIKLLIYINSTAETAYYIIIFYGKIIERVFDNNLYDKNPITKTNRFWVLKKCVP